MVENTIVQNSPAIQSPPTVQHPLTFGVEIGLGFAIGLGIGIAIGTTAAILIYKRHYEKINTFLNNNAELSKQLKQIEEKKKKFDELVQNKLLVDTLTVKVLTDWFKEYRDQFANAYKMIVAIPSEDKLKGMGYFDVNLDPKTNILQFFYDDEKGIVLKMRIVGFHDIESNLQAQLIELDGMIVITN